MKNNMVRDKNLVKAVIAELAKEVKLSKHEFKETIEEAVNEAVSNDKNKRIIEYKLCLHPIERNGDADWYDGDDPDGLCEGNWAELRATSIESGLELIKDEVIKYMLDFEDCIDAQIKPGKIMQVEPNKGACKMFECIATAKEKQKYGNIIRSQSFIVRAYEVS